MPHPDMSQTRPRHCEDREWIGAELMATIGASQSAWPQVKGSSSEIKVGGDLTSSQEMIEFRVRSTADGISPSNAP